MPAMLAVVFATLLLVSLLFGWGLPIVAVLIVLLIIPVAILLISRESGEPADDTGAASAGETGAKPSWLRKRWYQ